MEKTREFAVVMEFIETMINQLHPILLLILMFGLLIGYVFLVLYIWGSIYFSIYPSHYRIVLNKMAENEKQEILAASDDIDLDIITNPSKTENEISFFKLLARKNRKETAKLKKTLEKILELKKNHPIFAEKVAELKKKQRFSRAFFGWLLVGVAFAPIALFYLNFGNLVGEKFDQFDGKISIKNIKLTDEKIADQIGKINSLTTIIQNVDKQPFNVTQSAVEALPIELSILQVYLDVQQENSAETKQMLLAEKVEAENLRIRVQILNKLSDEELISVKALVFEESEKSSRRYFLFGLFFSIPFFWFSEFLKYWLVRFIKSERFLSLIMLKSKRK